MTLAFLWLTDKHWARIAYVGRTVHGGTRQHSRISHNRNASSRVHDGRKRAREPVKLQCIPRGRKHGGRLSLPHESPHHLNLKSHTFSMELINEPTGKWAGQLPRTGVLVFHLLLRVKHTCWGNLSCFPIQHNSGRVHRSKQCWQVKTNHYFATYLVP